MTWLLFAFISALLSAAAAVSQKRVLFRLTAIEFSFLVSAAILAVSLFIPLTTSINLPESQLFVVIGKSVLSGAAFLLVMVSLRNNPISSALPLLALTPAVAALASWAIIGESLQGVEWLGVCLMAVGTWMIERQSRHRLLEPFKTAFSSKDHLSTLGALLLFAISSVADRVLVGTKRMEPLAVLFYQHLVYLILFGIVLFMRRTSFREVAVKLRQNFPLIALIAILTIAYRFAQLEATKDAPVAMVLAVKRTSVLFASFIGGRLFSEERLREKILGAVLIVAAGFLILRNIG